MTPKTTKVGAAPTVGARVAVVVAAVCGVLAMSSTALVHSPHVAALACACAALFAAAAWAPVSWPSPAGIRVRQLISFVILGTTLVLSLVNLLRVRPSNIVDAALDSGGLLGWLLVAVLLAQLFITDKIRELRVALLLTVAMFVLAVAYHPGPVVVVALLVGWPAVVTVLAFDHAAREQTKADVVARLASAAPRMGWWTRVGGFAAISAVVAVLLVALAPHPAGVRPHGDGGSGAGGDTRSDSTPGATQRNSASYTTGSMDMRARGPLPVTPMADVPLDSPALWRGATLDYYDGTSWGASGDGGQASLVPGGPHYDLSTGEAALTGAGRRDLVHRRPNFLGTVIAPGQPTALDVAGRVGRTPGGYFVAPPRVGAYPMTYTVTSTTTDRLPSELSGTLVAVPAGEYVPDNALQLPDSVPERVRLLGRHITGSAVDRPAATRAVETYLRGHATYRLDSPVPKSGEDAVDNFLFVAHTGFCEQFAAAEVVLLRASGVPARLATGFSGGEASGNRRTLRGSDAHAWVEVWYPRVGWAASDPTAGTRLAADVSLRDRLVAWLHSTAARRLLAAAGLLVVTALVLVLRWWLRRRARRARDRRGPVRAAGRPLPPVLAAFDRLQRALADAGTPRAPAESVSELAARPSMRPAAGALAVVERTSYAARAPEGAEADDAERTLNDLASQLRADLEAAGGPADGRPRPTV